MGELAAVNQYLYKYRLTLFLGIVFTIASNYLSSLAPEVVSQTIDFAQSKEATSYIDWVPTGDSVSTGVWRGAVLILVLALLSGFFLFLMRKTIIVASHKIVADIRHDLYSHYQSFDQEYLKQNSTGDLMSRLTEDISNVRMYVGPAFMYFANTIAMFGFYIYRMIKADAVLSFWTLLPLPILSISIYVVSSIIFKKTNEIQSQLSALTSFVQESFSGIRVIKSYAREESFMHEFEQESEQYRQQSLSLARVESFFFPLMMLLIGMSTIIAVFVSGKHYNAGIIGSGTIVQFIIYVGRLTWPVTSLGWIASIVQKAAASQKRINEMKSVHSKIYNTDKPVHLENEHQHIEFQNVSFTYPETGIQALKQVSFEIKSGDRVAIIGRTGSGKSTIADLLLRFYTPQEGRIVLNGVDIKDYDLSELRKAIGFVPQDVFLFSDTIANNIKLAKPNAELSEIQSVAHTAAVAKDIESFPNQYDTVVGERGVMLSGGQKQRISIARAILDEPDLLILDDALSAVDANTEQEIMAQFDALFQSKTVLIITHRIFSLFEVDQILVFDEGELVQNGIHSDLVQEKGIYQELYELQQSENNF